ncbi:hypothetical protein H9P43_010036 [Blastocladiella emersonii ATCC 22665]|nr:hypothetical protein H9P43_010036 [Blastocladiella emersonii ATCC 22665]
MLPSWRNKDFSSSSSSGSDDDDRGNTAVLTRQLLKQPSAPTREVGDPAIAGNAVVASSSPPRRAPLDPPLHAAAATQGTPQRPVLPSLLTQQTPSATTGGAPADPVMAAAATTTASDADLLRAVDQAIPDAAALALALQLTAASVSPNTSGRSAGTAAGSNTSSSAATTDPSGMSRSSSAYSAMLPAWAAAMSPSSRASGAVLPLSSSASSGAITPPGSSADAVTPDAARRTRVLLSGITSSSLFGVPLNSASVESGAPIPTVIPPPSARAPNSSSVPGALPPASPAALDRAAQVKAYLSDRYASVYAALPDASAAGSESAVPPTPPGYNPLRALRRRYLQQPSHSGSRYHPHHPLSPAQAAQTAPAPPPLHRKNLSVSTTAQSVFSSGSESSPLRAGGAAATPQSATAPAAAAAPGSGFPFGRRRRWCEWEVENGELALDLSLATAPPSSAESLESSVDTRLTRAARAASAPGLDGAGDLAPLGAIPGSSMYASSASGEHAMGSGGAIGSTAGTGASQHRLPSTSGRSSSGGHVGGSEPTVATRDAAEPVNQQQPVRVQSGRRRSVPINSPRMGPLPPSATSPKYAAYGGGALETIPGTLPKSGSLVVVHNGGGDDDVADEETGLGALVLPPPAFVPDPVDPAALGDSSNSQPSRLATIDSWTPATAAVLDLPAWTLSSADRAVILATARTARVLGDSVAPRLDALDTAGVQLLDDVRGACSRASAVASDAAKRAGEVRAAWTAVPEIGKVLAAWDSALQRAERDLAVARDTQREIEGEADGLAGMMEDLQWDINGKYLQTIKRVEDHALGRTRRAPGDDAVLETAYTLLSYLLAGLSALLWAVLLAIRAVRSVLWFVSAPVRWVWPRARSAVGVGSETLALLSSSPIATSSGDAARASIMMSMPTRIGTLGIGSGEHTARMTEQLERMTNPDEWKARIEQLFDAGGPLRSGSLFVSGSGSLLAMTPAASGMPATPRRTPTPPVPVTSSPLVASPMMAAGELVIENE